MRGCPDRAAPRTGGLPVEALTSFTPRNPAPFDFVPESACLAPRPGPCPFPDRFPEGGCGIPQSRCNDPRFARNAVSGMPGGSLPGRHP
jgi:hypothetical protein